MKLSCYAWLAHHNMGFLGCRLHQVQVCEILSMLEDICFPVWELFRYQPVTCRWSSSAWPSTGWSLLTSFSKVHSTSSDHPSVTGGLLIVYLPCPHMCIKYVGKSVRRQNIGENHQSPGILQWLGHKTIEKETGYLRFPKVGLYKYKFKDIGSGWPSLQGSGKLYMRIPSWEPHTPWLDLEQHPF